MEHRIQVGIICPQCNTKQFMETELDDMLLASPIAKEIKQQLTEWIASRCPDHLGAIASLSRN